MVRAGGRFSFSQKSLTVVSILIPVFDYDVRPLVKELLQQGRLAGVFFEILCLDDASNESFCVLNREITAWQGVRYEELPANVGRSRIRNLLAEKARYEYLLFMDCDSGVVHSDYLARYLQHQEPDLLLYGGRCYSAQPPAAQAYLLHWHFGKKREEIPVAQRQADPYHSFMTNNFWIPRSIFQTIKFAEDLREYGHEDTLFGQELAAKQVRILHLDNPLEHLGLEPAAVFLQKNETAIKNLVFLAQKGTPVTTRLNHVFQTLKKLRLNSIFSLFFRPAEPLIRRYLIQSKHPNLLWLDVFKLGKICVYTKIP